MKKKIALMVSVMLAGVLLGAVLVSAQQPQQPPQQPPPTSQPRQPRPPHPPMNDPLGDAMFPPEMIMSHTRDLGLTDEQKTYMRAEIQKTTTRFNELQWQLQDAMEALHGLMTAKPVNEQAALSQLDKVLDAEREIKRLHFGLAISIKNKLTPEQQDKLHGMMRMRHGPDGPGPGPGGPGRGPGPGPGGPPPNRPEGEPFM
ncbi:MAG: Spy/CpxP family protein refolding chaperone [Acidobacteriota bacterium]